MINVINNNIVWILLLFISQFNHVFLTYWYIKLQLIKTNNNNNVHKISIKHVDLSTLAFTVSLQFNALLRQGTQFDDVTSSAADSDDVIVLCVVIIAVTNH